MKKIVALLLTILMLCAFSACNKPEPQDLTVYAPDGAPALAISKLISDNDNLGLGGTVSYNVVSSSDIGAIMMQGKGDIIVMPVISQRGIEIPSSPIRKLTPLGNNAKARGIKVYHLNIGQSIPHYHLYLQGEGPKRMERMYM